MNVHKNARLTFVRRLEMVKDIVEAGLTPAEAAAEVGVSEPTACKWLGRYLAEGEAGLRFLARDIAGRPERIRALGRRGAARIRALVKGVKVDLEGPLDPGGE